VRAIKLFVTFCLVGLLTACGFQLRGDYALPFQTMSIALAPSSELYAQLKRSIEASSPTRIVDDPKEAEANLIVLGDRNEKVILTLNSAGRAREYDLVRTFSFKVSSANSADYIPPSQIVLRRNMTFNDDLVLSKESEEVLLWRDMQKDLIQQILRRLATAKRKATSESGDAATP
jgi:LPS-assembly lipoprotein